MLAEPPAPVGLGGARRGCPRCRASSENPHPAALTPLLDCVGLPAFQLKSMSRTTPGPRPHPSPRVKQIATFVVLCLLGVASIWGVYWYAERNGTQTMIDNAQHRLDLYESAVNGTLTRYDYLPRLISLNPNLASLLRDPDNRALVGMLNHYLADVNASARASAIYVIDLRGKTIAASNWNQPDSFVGQNYSYRPYFIDALHNGSGRFYGLGTVSRTPGYYHATQINDEHGVKIGVVVIKIDLDVIESMWQRSPETLVVTDSNGVVFLTSFAGWKYRTLKPLSPAVRKHIEDTRQYEVEGGLEPIGLVDKRRLTEHATLQTISRRRAPPSRAGLSFEPEFIAVTRPVSGTNWQIMSFSDTSSVRFAARSAALVASFGFALAAIGFLYLMQRRRIVAQQLAMRATLKQMNDELERKVLRRTEALTKANRSLRNEVSGHRATERQLKETVEELVQAGKLALLGQMAASVTHELNQPLVALRTLSDNAIRFLELGRYDNGIDNLHSIVRLTERMSSITSQLRRFAYKSHAHLDVVQVDRAIGNALSLMELRIRREDVTVDRAGDTGLCVVADSNRLEQVLVNLFANALDAMAQSDTRVLMITVGRQADGVSIIVTDSGPGIGAENLDHIFEPFFTTKTRGVGLGLGLAISQGIVRDMGGVLRGGNGVSGGAEFCLLLRIGLPNDDH
ncbi:sensor histidine kinase [Burkholderia gladioli]|uniref:sensor histidine kinase n=1 Tax=Burkholderia gladioli TaxID=28095 RepID=UPI0016411E54|nr:cache domain-containing protein [Burkholderia gladioli]